MTDTALKQLRSLKKLKQIDLSFTQVSEEGIEELKQAIPNLQVTW